MVFPLHKCGGYNHLGMRIIANPPLPVKHKPLQNKNLEPLGVN